MFRASFGLTNEENLGSITIKYGSYSKTYSVDYPYPEGGTDVIPKQSYTNPADIEYTYNVVINDPYSDPTKAMYHYTFQFESEASAFNSLEGMILTSPNYCPIYIKQENEDEYTFNTYPSIVYTDSTTLTTGATIYDNNGEDTGLIIDTINQDGTFEITNK